MYPCGIVVSMKEDIELCTLHEVADDLWQEVPLTHDARIALTQLEKRARAQFTQTLAPLGIDTIQATDTLRKSFGTNDLHETDELFATLTQRAVELEWKMIQFTHVMRAFNMFIGNHVARNVHGEPYSPILARAYTATSESLIERFHELPVRLEAIHNAIDAFMEELVAIHTKDRDRIAKLFPDEPIVTIFTDIIEWHEGVRDVAHFAVDWYADEVPNDVLKKTPEQSAVLLLLAVEEINVNGPAQQRPLLDKELLRKRGGWKSVPRQSMMRLAEILGGALPTLEPLTITRGVPERDVSDSDQQPHDSERPTMQMVGSLPDELDPHEFELRLAILFERYGLPGEESVQRVRTMVYEMDKVEEGTAGVLSAYHEAFQALFPTTVATNEHARMELYATVVDAWNVFPHKALNGKSPLDMVRSADGA